MLSMVFELYFFFFFLGGGVVSLPGSATANIHHSLLLVYIYVIYPSQGPYNILESVCGGTGGADHPNS